MAHPPAGAAQVLIDVAAAGDSTAPRVLWTIPDVDASVVAASAAPVYTDTVGPLFTPSILIGVSEALSETTVSGTTVTLAHRGGAGVTASVGFETGTNQIILRPRAALAVGEYTVTVGTGVRDIAGNGLAPTHGTSAWVTKKWKRISICQP